MSLAAALDRLRSHDSYDPAAIAALTGVAVDQVAWQLAPERRYRLDLSTPATLTGRRGDQAVILGRSAELDDDHRAFHLVIADSDGAITGGESYRIEGDCSLQAMVQQLGIAPGPVDVCCFAHPMVPWFGLVPLSGAAHAALEAGDGGAVQGWLEKRVARFVYENTEVNAPCADA